MITLLAMVVAETPASLEINATYWAQCLSTVFSKGDRKCCNLEQHSSKAMCLRLCPPRHCWELVEPGEMGLNELSLHHWGLYSWRGQGSPGLVLFSGTRRSSCSIPCSCHDELPHQRDHHRMPRVTSILHCLVMWVSTLAFKLVVQTSHLQNNIPYYFSISKSHNS